LAQGCSRQTLDAEPDADSMVHDVASSESRYMGPSMADFLQVCSEREPIKLGITVSSAFLGLAITSVLCFCHYRSLSKAPINVRRMYYTTLAFFPGVFAITAFLSVLSPVSILFLKTIQQGYEALVLSRFGMLLFVLLTWESFRLAGKDVLHVSPEHQTPEQSVQHILTALAKNGPRKHFAAPPLACCFSKCMTSFDLSLSHLQALFLMVRQYTIVMPVSGILLTFLFTALPVASTMKVAGMVKYLLMASNILCLYGLFILYLSTHDVLHAWDTSKKFIAIKVPLVLFVYQEFLIKKLLPGFLNEDSCFQHVGFAYHEWTEVETEFWGMWAMAIESVGVAVLIRRAFTANDIRKPIFEVHHQVLSMAISQDHGNDVEKGEGPADDVQSTSASEGEL